MGNTALNAILNREEGVEATQSVKPKRGSNTHLGALTNELKSLAIAERLPADTDIVELDPATIVFSDDINHRCQEWLSEDNKDFQMLVESIKLAGQKLPIMVRPAGNDRFELIYGSRRRQAAAFLGIKVKAIVANGVSDNDAHELAILENTNHAGLSPIEEARAVLAYKERNAPIPDLDVATVFTKSRQWVGFQVSFANLDPAFIEQCSNPWMIKERGTRELRSKWNNNKAQREKWKRVLTKLEAQDKKLPYKKLVDHLMGIATQSEVEILKDKEGRVIAEVGSTSIKNGRRVRRLCIYEDFETVSLKKLIGSLAADFDAKISD